MLMEMLPSVLSAQKEFPIFLKSCHLTAGLCCTPCVRDRCNGCPGADNSVYKPPLGSSAQFEKEKLQIRNWVLEKWNQR